VKKWHLLAGPEQKYEISQDINIFRDLITSTIMFITKIAKT
jgi:hypothetical protein